MFFDVHYAFYLYCKIHDTRVWDLGLTQSQYDYQKEHLHNNKSLKKINII